MHISRPKPAALASMSASWSAVASTRLVTLHTLIIKGNCDANPLAVIKKLALTLKPPLDELLVDIQFWKSLRYIACLAVSDG